MKYFMGVDIGSVSTKVVLISANEGIKIVASKVAPTGVRGNEVANKLIDEILMEVNLKRDDLSLILATGYGRINVDFTDITKTEISCHAKGAKYLFPNVHTIIDIGGQDSKAIRVGDMGEVLDFAMNDKCAAGTGRFLEVMSHALQEKLDNFGILHKEAKNTVEITSICTVFAESEVVSLLAEGKDKKDVIKGINYSVAKRALSLMKRVGIKEEIVMTGGVAKNSGVVMALEDLLKLKINIPEHPQIMGALGAALFAKEMMEVKSGRDN